MKAEELAPLEKAYRLAAKETPGAGMDDAILRRADRVASTRRSIRHAGLSCIAVFACLSAWMLSHNGLDRIRPHQSPQAQSTAPPGLAEGQTRPYLLDVSVPRWPQSQIALALTGMTTKTTAYTHPIPASAPEDLLP